MFRLPCIISCCSVAALAAPALAQSPSYSVQSRWAVNTVIPASGATSITLTLQGRAVFNGAFPSDSPTSLFGDFGMYAMGYGPQGQSQPSTMTRTDPSVIIRRGDWGTFIVRDDGGDPVTTPFLRGASPGTYDPAAQSLSRGLRFGIVGSLIPEIPDPNLPGPSVGDMTPNGAWLPNGNMTSFNLLRDDFQSTTPQARNLSDPAGGPAWMDLFRIRIDTLTPVVLGPGGFTVDFDGWFRAAGASNLVSGNWTLAGGSSLPSTTSIGFTSVPSPAAVAPMVLGLFAARRRRG